MTREVQAPVIEPLEAAEYGRVAALLESVKLPTEGLEDHLDHILVARRGGDVVGCVALELYSDGALLRSLAVVPAEQGTGTGVALTQAVLDLAGELGVPVVYLLTETAAEFFPRFGFTETTRAEAPAGVKQSVEFTTVCCESAVLMRLEL